VLEKTTSFLDVVSSEQCFLEQIRGNSPDLPQSVASWIDGSRVAHDEVVTAFISPLRELVGFDQPPSWSGLSR
jgi:hypothetical protein